MTIRGIEADVCWIDECVNYKMEGSAFYDTFDFWQKRAAYLDNEMIKEMLGQWVSEFEPVIVMQFGQIIGLTIADILSQRPIFLVIEATSKVWWANNSWTVQLKKVGQ